MPNYRYFATYNRFFPDKRDDNGQSLMAVSGVVVEFDSPPSTAEWVETDEPVTWPVHVAPAGPEPATEAPVAEPEPVPVPVPQEPAPAPVAQPEPIPVAPFPHQPMPRQPVPQPVPDGGGFTAPYSR